jgi:cell division protein FtsN
MVLTTAGCSRQQSDWEKARAANTTDSYEFFLKKYPAGEFTAQAQARVKELYEERDWQKARDADTPEAYQAFLKQYPEGKWTEEARIRVENFTLAQAPGAPAGAEPAGGNPAPAAATGPGPAMAGPETPPSQPVPKPAAKSAPKSVPQSVPKSAAKSSSTKGAAAADGYGVQLGAFASGADAANKRWAELTAKFPTVLAGLTPKVSPAKAKSGTLYRLQVAGMPEKNARAICASLKAKSQACVLIIPH